MKYNSNSTKKSNSKKEKYSGEGKAAYPVKNLATPKSSAFRGKK